MKDANVLRIRNRGNSYTLAFQMETVQLCNITAVIRDRNILTVKMYEIWPLSWRRRPLSLQAWRQKPSFHLVQLLSRYRCRDRFNTAKNTGYLEETRIVPEIWYAFLIISRKLETRFLHVCPHGTPGRVQTVSQSASREPPNLNFPDEVTTNRWNVVLISLDN